MLAAAAALVMLVEQIDRVAASEPVVYGIDTRLRVADVLAAKNPSIAKRELRDVEAALSGVSDRDYRDKLRVRLIQSFAPLDFVEAERVAKSIEPQRTHDRLAEAYGRLYEKAGTRNRLDLILTAFNAGAFRVHFDPEAFSPEERLRIFSAIVDSFPAGKPDGADVDYLLDRTKEMMAFSREVTISAIRKAIAAADSTPNPKRAQTRFRAAELLRAIGSDLPEEFGPILREPEPPPASVPKKPGEADPPDLSNVPYSEALERSLKLETPLMRAASLIDLSRREDLSPKQQARVASEALSAVDSLPVSEDRLVALSMLSRDFAKRHELANASLAAQMLSESFSKACDCGSAVCKLNEEEFQCVELVNDYAEYLDELNFTQESLGLNNISLEARLLIFKLQKMVKAQ